MALKRTCFCCYNTFRTQKGARVLATVLRYSDVTWFSGICKHADPAKTLFNKKNPNLPPIYLPSRAIIQLVASMLRWPLLRIRQRATKERYARSKVCQCWKNVILKKASSWLFPNAVGTIDQYFSMKSATHPGVIPYGDAFFYGVPTNQK